MKVKSPRSYLLQDRGSCPSTIPAHIPLKYILVEDPLSFGAPDVDSVSTRFNNHSDFTWRLKVSSIQDEVPYQIPRARNPAKVANGGLVQCWRITYSSLEAIKGIWRADGGRADLMRWVTFISYHRHAGKLSRKKLNDAPSYFWTPPGFAWFFQLPKEEHPIGAEHDMIKNNFHSCLRHSCHRVPASISAWAVSSLLKLPTPLKHLPFIALILIETMDQEMPD